MNTGTTMGVIQERNNFESQYSHICTIIISLKDFHYTNLPQHIAMAMAR